MKLTDQQRSWLELYKKPTRGGYSRIRLSLHLTVLVSYLLIAVLVLPHVSTQLLPSWATNLTIFVSYVLMLWQLCVTLAFVVIGVCLAVMSHQATHSNDRDAHVILMELLAAIHLQKTSWLRRWGSVLYLHVALSGLILAAAMSGWYARAAFLLLAYAGLFATLRVVRGFVNEYLQNLDNGKLALRDPQRYALLPAEIRDARTRHIDIGELHA